VAGVKLIKRAAARAITLSCCVLVRPFPKLTVWFDLKMKMSRRPSEVLGAVPDLIMVIESIGNRMNDPTMYRSSELSRNISVWSRERKHSWKILEFTLQGADSGVLIRALCDHAPLNHYLDSSL
jgi:hypothetical protein